jgi:hypothetical protein
VPVVHHLAAQSRRVAEVVELTVLAAQLPRPAVVAEPVGEGGGRLTFAVTKVEQVAKKEFPTKAVYGDTTDAELRLITCGGRYDAANRNYLDNVVVYPKLKR